MKDDLTGALNKEAFEFILEREWRRAARSEAALHLLAVDIDQFRMFNDYLGTEEGDKCLIAVADVLIEAASRPGDFVFRLRADEFRVILGEIDIAGAKIVSENIRERIGELGIRHPRSESGRFVTVSIGIGAATPSVSESVAGLKDAAETALTEAIVTGGDRVEVAPEPVDA